VKKTRRKSGQRFARIKALHCRAEVDERLVAGYPVAAVAQYIQEDEGEYGDIERRSLAELLRRYAVEELAKSAIVRAHLPGYVVQVTKEFGERFEDLRRLERAYEALLYRFDLSHGHERRTGEIDPDVTRQTKGLVDLICRMHEIKMDLGLSNGRELGALTVSPERLEEIRTRYGEGAARAFADPVQRAQVLGLLHRVMRLSDRTAIDDKVVDGDGDSSAPARPDAIEEAPPRRAADYDSVEDDEDEGLWGPR